MLQPTVRSGGNGFFSLSLPPGFNLRHSDNRINPLFVKIDCLDTIVRLFRYNECGF
jgi:hypothetical protein